jgi:glycosidase
MTRLFCNTKEGIVKNGDLAQNGTGKMSFFTDKALKSIKKIGVTHIWYTGIIEHATCEKYDDYNIVSQNPYIVKGRAGSPYAITDYYDVNPYLADDVTKRIEEFEDLVKRTHKNKLKVIIDFVPNHVARQYKSDVYPDRDFGINDDTSLSFSPNNDFYYIPNEPLHLSEGIGSVLEGETVDRYEEYPAKATGNDQFHAYPSKDDWYETVKLNYGVDYLNGGAKHFDTPPPLWDKMVDILNYWCSKGVDGIRCDMAEMVPVEFWEYAIGKVKKNYPDIIFIAEVYNPAQYHNYIKIGGFDYLYDKVGLYDSLRNIICNNHSAQEITHCWQKLGGIDDNMLSFLENHDEQRVASRFFATNPQYAIPAMVVSATINRGAIMIYFGQEFGEPALGESGYSGDDGRTTIFDFYNVPEFNKWCNDEKFNTTKLSKEQKQLYKEYSKILSLSIKNKAVSEGGFYDLMWVNNFNGGPDTRYIYSYLRYYKNEILLFVVNFNKIEKQNFKLKIPEDALGLMGVKGNIVIKDSFSKKEIVETNQQQLINEGFKIDLPALGYGIFNILEQ